MDELDELIRRVEIYRLSSGQQNRLIADAALRQLRIFKAWLSIEIDRRTA